MNDYTRPPKLPNGACWETVSNHFYSNAAGVDRLIVKREMAITPATIGGKVGNTTPVIDQKTGKQLKRCIQHFINCPEGKKPEYWRPLPYKLPELIQAIKAKRPIYIVEGEPKVDLLRSWGLDATCNSEGAGKWSLDHADWLIGAEVVVLPDNDEPGRRHADLVGSTLKGRAKSVRLLELPGLPEGGDIVDWNKTGGTKEQLEQLVTKAPEWTTYYTDTPGVVPELEVWDAGQDDYSNIPPREWLLGNIFCLGFLSGVLGPGATGKSALRHAQYIALASGRELTGEHIFRRCRVLLVSLEDDRNELRRRIRAVCIHHKVDPAELKGWLFYATPKGVKLAQLGKKGAPQRGVLEEMLRAAIAKYQPQLVSLDPFIKLHSLDENSNPEMDFVCDLLTQLASEFNIAVDAPHHTRKGALVAGDADMGRGASAMRDAGRLVYTLTRMGDDEAERFGIPLDKQRSFIRLDNAKVNTAQQSREATWFRLVGIPLGNTTERYPNGDVVQTVEPWYPPELWEGVSDDAIGACLKTFDAGLANGQRYTNASRAGEDRAAWKVVQQHCPEKTEKQGREMVSVWVKNGLLEETPYHDPVQSKDRLGLFLGPKKFVPTDQFAF